MVASNLEGITLPQDNSQHIISQYIDDTSFTVKAKETSVGHLVGILHKFNMPHDLKQIGIKAWCIGAVKDIPQDGWENTNGNGQLVGTSQNF